jgi:co-chaperonin GroES (HSP10)
MIKAVDDKIIVDVMRPSKTKGGLLLPSTSSEPQSYGKVNSVGDAITTIKLGQILVFHPKAGMDMVIGERLLKVLKYGEIYGILQDKDTEDLLDIITIGSANP